MPTTTYELRWFTREQPFEPTAVFGSEIEPEERCDWYAASAHPGTGTKLRDGRLETKLLTDTVETVDHAGCQGVIERWQKWSVLMTEAGPPEDLLTSNGWVAVKKRRWLQIWSTESAHLELVHDRAGKGALFELTLISVNGSIWWTVALEAFGPEGERRPALEKVMTHVLGHLPAHCHLTLSESMSYPAWLLRID